MKIKLLQLNMWAGTKWDALSDFLKKNSFDILMLQEVAGENTHCGNVHCEKDCFQALQKLLGPHYNGILTKTTTFTSDPMKSYEGNATFYKKGFLLKGKHVLPLYQGPNPFPSDAKSFENESRDVLHIVLEKNGKTIHIINTHLAWAPTQHEQPHQRKQNKKLIEYIDNLSLPFVLSGDFNISLLEPTIVDLGKRAKNLTQEYQIPNTIDTVNHVSWEKIKPGFPI